MSDETHGNDTAGDGAPPDPAERNRQVVALREAGATWLQIQQRFDLSRQQARYAYQVGKRMQRRAARRES